jgi:hypothetical protein
MYYIICWRSNRVSGPGQGTLGAVLCRYPDISFDILLTRMIRFHVGNGLSSAHILLPIHPDHPLSRDQPIVLPDA